MSLRCNSILDHPIITSCKFFKKQHQCLTHNDLVMPYNITELGHHWFRQGLVGNFAPSHYLNQCWLFSFKPLGTNSSESLFKILYTYCLCNFSHFVSASVCKVFILFPVGSGSHFGSCWHQWLPNTASQVQSIWTFKLLLYDFCDLVAICLMGYDWMRLQVVIYWMV